MSQTLRINGTDSIEAHFADADGKDVTIGSITFNSDNAAVVSVTQTGESDAVVTAVGVGTANITATMSSPSGHSVDTTPRSYTVDDAPAVPAVGEAVSGALSAQGDSPTPVVTPAPAPVVAPVAPPVAVNPAPVLPLPPAPVDTTTGGTVPPPVV